MNKRYSLVCVGEFLVLDNKEQKVCFKGDLNQVEVWLDQNENKMPDPTPEEPKPRKSYATIIALATIVLFCIYMIIKDNNRQAEAEKKTKEAEKIEQTITEADIPPSLKELSEPPKETSDDTEVVIEKVPKAKSNDNGN